MKAAQNKPFPPKKQAVEPDADDKKPPMKKKGKAKAPVGKIQPQWAGIANKMLGNE